MKSCDAFERVEPGRQRLVEGQPHRRGLRVGVGRPGQGAVVGEDGLAEGHPDRQLALVVALVGVELWAGRVADEPEPVRHAEPAVVGERGAVGQVEPVVLEAQVIEAEVPAHGQQHCVPFGGRPVVQVDRVGAVGPGAGPGAHRPDAEADADARSHEGRADGFGVAGMLGRHQPRAGLDDRHGHAEPGVDLRELAAGRPAADDEQALGQLAGQRRLAVRPVRDVADPVEGRDLGGGADGHDDVVTGQLRGGPLVRHVDPPAADDAPGPAEGPGARVLERFDMARVVGLLGVRRAVDHVVAAGRGAGPVVFGGVGRVTRRGVEQRLGRHATDVRARPAEPLLVDDRDALPELAGLVRGRLAARTGADDHEVEGVHGGYGASPLAGPAARWRRAS